MAKINKERTTKQVMEIAKDQIRECKKLQMDNIIFPKWDDLGLLGLIFRQDVKTKEQPDGCIYDEATYRVVMRVINGKVLMTGGRPDAYTWKHQKVESSKNVRFIGCNSAEALINLSGMLETIFDVEEKKMFADMFCNMKKDLLLVTSAEESRRCVEISPDLYAAGITSCVDEWMEVDSNGEAEETRLNVGDFLIVNEAGNSVYCIRREEFLETHSL